MMGFNSPYDGVEGQIQHSSEMRRFFPGSHTTGIPPMGNGIRDPVVSSNVSFKGIGFGESFRFNEVLQGQEIFPGSPYGRATHTNEAFENGCLGISSGVQTPSSRDCFVMQSKVSHIRPAPAQVSSPSSVLMFQQANNPFLNPVAMSNTNDREEHGVNSQYKFQNTETYADKFLMSSRSKHKAENPGGIRSLGLTEHVHQRVAHPLIAQASSKPGQEVVSSCKSSCRLFGFSLTEGSLVTTDKNNPSPIAPPGVPGSFLPRVGEQFHLKPPAINNIASNYTQVSDFCAGDMIFDISL